MLQNLTYIYGKHAVREALQSNPALIERLLFIDGFKDDSIESVAKKSRLAISGIRSGQLPKEIDPEAVHQGVIASIKINNLVQPYKEFIEQLKVDNNTSLVLLDEIEDPQNVGAIIRSAVAFGLSGVLIPAHNQAQVTGSVIKVSAGMAFKIPLVSISNVNTTLRDLKDRRFWIYGLTSAGEQNINKEKFEEPTIFVVGAEAKGIREKTLELCDIKLRIPIDSRCESLNAATSASVAFFAWSREHLK